MMVQALEVLDSCESLERYIWYICHQEEKTVSSCFFHALTISYSSTPTDYSLLAIGSQLVKYRYLPTLYFVLAAFWFYKYCTHSNKNFSKLLNFVLFETMNRQFVESCLLNFQRYCPVLLLQVVSVIFAAFVSVVIFWFLLQWFLLLFWSISNFICFYGIIIKQFNNIFYAL